ncbi:MAG TPA: ATP-binding cassette domain-containing protein [Ktedonobacterales bacterium]|nr:ATP-binding cassette domain-containing protein [Ktedonobacterales bacterium]
MKNDANVIVAEDLRKYYGDTKAVDGVTLSVGQGEIFGMLGPNGAGKSTTIEMLEGLRVADAGAISVLGMRQPQDAQKIKGRIGIQLQTTALYPRLTVTEILDLFHAFFPARQTLSTDELIRLVDLDEKRNTRSKQLSGGQKQRLSVALALVNDPEIVFFDEPTTGMDPQARRQLWDVIGDLRRRGKTILLTTHYMEEADQLCDRLAIMDHGKILALDTPAGLKASVGADSIVTVHALGDLNELSALLQQEVAGVISVNQVDNSLQVHVKGASSIVPPIVTVAERGGFLLQDLSVAEPTLETVFINLTGKELRD